MLKRIADNFIQHISLLPLQTPGMSVHKTDGVIYVDSGLSCDTFNIIHVETGADPSPLAFAVDHFKGQKLDFCVWITRNSYARKFKEICEKAKLRVNGVEPAMILDLHSFQTSPNVLWNHIYPVDSMEALEPFAKVVADNWSPPDQNVITFYQRVGPSVLETDQLRLFYYLMNGHVVGTVELCRSGDTMGIYGLATLEKMRGQGIGSAMMSYVLNLAKEEGCQYATLQASEDGIGIYEKMGFSRVTDYLELG